MARWFRNKFCLFGLFGRAILIRSMAWTTRMFSLFRLGCIFSRTIRSFRCAWDFISCFSFFGTRNFNVLIQQFSLLVLYCLLFFTEFFQFLRIFCRLFLLQSLSSLVPFGHSWNLPFPQHSSFFSLTSFRRSYADLIDSVILFPFAASERLSQLVKTFEIQVHPFLYSFFKFSALFPFFSLFSCCSFCFSNSNLSMYNEWAFLAGASTFLFRVRFSGLQSSGSETFTVSFMVLKSLIVVSLKDALSGVTTYVFSDNALSTSALPCGKTNAFFTTLVKNCYFGLPLLCLMPNKSLQ